MFQKHCLKTYPDLFEKIQKEFKEKDLNYFEYLTQTFIQLHVILLCIKYVF